MSRVHFTHLFAFHHVFVDASSSSSSSSPSSHGGDADKENSGKIIDETLAEKKAVAFSDYRLD